MQFSWDWADLGWAHLGLASSCRFDRGLIQIPHSPWISGYLSHGEKKDVQNGKPNRAYVFQASAFVIFSNVSLTKARHVGTMKVKGQGDTPPPVGGRGD